MATESYRQLLVWQKGMDLATETYRLSGKIPGAQRRPLVDQMTRAAVSIPANIAEGSGRVSRRSYIHFLRIARGSLFELDTHLELTVRLGFLSDVESSRARGLIQDVSRLLTRLAQALQRRV